MYESHFGLKESPFGITPNPAFFYPGNTRGEILQGLLYVVGHGEGVIKVTGEVGSGKTMLCRMLEEQLPPHIEAIYLVNPSLSPLEAVFAIAGELGLNPAGKRSDEVLRELHADLIAKHAAGKQVVLLVEEAQAMPLDTLEEIRLLTNLETARNKLLQIVLFGQPELDTHLNLSRMRQLKERITHSFEVPVMPADLVPEFIDFRLRAAGYEGPPLFSDEAARLIAKASRGIVRRINILADKALMAAFAVDAQAVTVRHARAAVAESPYSQRRNLASVMTTGRITAGLSALIVVLLAGLAWQILHEPLWSMTLPAAARGAVPNAPAPPPEPPAAVRSGALPAPALPEATTATALPATGLAKLRTLTSADAVAMVAAAQAATRPAPTQAPLAAPARTPSITPALLPAPAGQLTLLQQSLRATKTWLRDEPAGHLSLLIETMPASDKDGLETFLRNTRSAIGLAEVHAVPLRRGGENKIAIVYGSFDTLAQAQRVQTLLAERGAFKPLIRDIQDMRDDAAGAASAW